ncbi:MAG: ribonuclease Z [Acidimicrobiaceae bacterium]|nr:ribonuclease Z [Acidimicrobiaceae bacterium]
MIVTLLGTGSPIPAPDRAGPATLVTVTAADATRHLLVDAGRGVLMRMAAAGVGAGDLAAVLITHLHSDHITDLNDVITTRWVTSFAPNPLTIVGPVGTRDVVDHLLAALAPDIAYRIAHHDDLTEPPPVTVVEVEEGPIDVGVGVAVTCAPTDHKPVEPSLGYRIEHEGTAVVVAGDTVPCAGLDRLCDGADALVHTVIRKDLIENVPLQRMQDTLDYHSSPEEAGATAARAGVGTLVLTHYVPALTPDTAEEWRRRASLHFDGVVELGDDLHRIEIPPASGRHDLNTTI